MKRAQILDMYYAMCTPIERKLWDAMVRREVAFLPQYRIGPYRVDFALVASGAVRLAVECDGREWHERNWEHDLSRQNYIEGQGWHVLRFTGKRLYEDPDRCVDEIIEALLTYRRQERTAKGKELCLTAS